MHHANKTNQEYLICLVLIVSVIADTIAIIIGININIDILNIENISMILLILHYYKFNTINLS